LVLIINNGGDGLLWLSRVGGGERLHDGVKVLGWALFIAMFPPFRLLLHYGFMGFL
jgi:hypothetical protein